MDTISGGFFYDPMVSEGLTDSPWVIFGGAAEDIEDSNYWEANLFAYAID
jgi:hypothetical protein